MSGFAGADPCGVRVSDGVTAYDVEEAGRRVDYLVSFKLYSGIPLARSFVLDPVP